MLQVKVNRCKQNLYIVIYITGLRYSCYIFTAQLKQVQLRCTSYIGTGRHFWGTIVLSQEQSHCSEKRTNEQNSFLKMLEGFVKERNRTERKFLKRRFKIRNAFILSRTRSKSRTHFKSGMCFKSLEIIEIFFPSLSQSYTLLGPEII